MDLQFKFEANWSSSSQVYDCTYTPCGHHLISHILSKEAQCFPYKITLLQTRHLNPGDDVGSQC